MAKFGDMHKEGLSGKSAVICSVILLSVLFGCPSEHHYIPDLITSCPYFNILGRLSGIEEWY